MPRIKYSGRTKAEVDQEKEEMRSFLTENVYAALALGGVSPIAHKNIIDIALSHVMTVQGAGLLKDAAWIDAFSAIPDNVAGHIDIFIGHGFGRHDAVIATLKNPQLLIQSYQDTAARIESSKVNLAHEKIGMKPAETFAFLAGKPRLLTYDPDTVASIFKINLMLLESPFVALAYDSNGAYFRKLRVDRIKSQVGSVSNALLRMAAAEMSFLAPSKFNVHYHPHHRQYVDTAHSFHRPARGELETTMVRCLGYTGKCHVMEAPDDFLSCKTQAEMEVRLKDRRKHYVSGLEAFFDEAPISTQPRMWPLPLIESVTGMVELPKNPTESRDLRTRLALAGIIKNYRVACCD